MKIFKLNKQFILDNISQEQIFEAFLGIKVEFDTKYKSPFRHNDVDASCSFIYNRQGKLKFKDFGGTTNCDCFELVGILHGLDSNDSYGFMLVLDIIAKHFNLIKGTYTERKIQTQETYRPKKKVIPVVTDFDNNDIKYWQQGNVSLKKLKDSRIFKVKLIFIENDLIYVENYKNPAYLYVFTKNPDNTPKDFRIYFPLSKKNKFITTSNCIQGGDLLKYKQPFVIINKSFKDAVSLSTFFVEGKEIESFGLGSESTILSESSMNHLRSKYKYIFTLTDYDPAGLHCAWVHRKKYNTIPLFIKNKTWNSRVKYPVKDFWDLVKHLGPKKTQEIIDLNYKKIKEQLK